MVTVAQVAKNDKLSLKSFFLRGFFLLRKENITVLKYQIRLYFKS